MTLADRMNDMKARTIGHADLPDIGWPPSEQPADNGPPPGAKDGGISGQMAGPESISGQVAL